ncbi:MAG: T9SS type A sorting domain-containing protein [Cyclobacteriaceae bacterium]
MENELLTYIAYVALSLSAMYLVYFFALRRSTLFRFNRAYLLLILVLAFTLPLVNVPWLAEEPKPEPVASTGTNTDTIEQLLLLNPALLAASENQPPPEPTWTETAMERLPSLLLYLYAAGIAFCFIRLAVALVQVQLLKRGACKEVTEDGIAIYHSQKIKHPASFLRAVYLPSGLQPGKTSQAIMQHELAHVRQHHTLDVLLAEAGVALQWFNPFAWALRSSLREVHEFMADEASISTGDAAEAIRRHYQKALVAFSLRQKQTDLIHTFSQPTLKNRIIMMNKRRNTRRVGLRALLIIPMAVALLMLWAERADAQHTPAQLTKTTENDTPLYIVDGEITSSADNIAPKDIATIDVTADPETVSAYAGTEGQEVTKIVTRSGMATDGTEITTTGDDDQSLLYIIDGKKAESIRNVAPDNILTINVKGKEATEKHENKDIDGVVEIRTKQPEADTWNDIAQSIGTDPLFVVNGNIVNDVKIGLKGVKSTDVKNINVLRDKAATEKYGNKGLNGVVEITVDPKAIDQKNTAQDTGNDPLYVIHGRIVQHAEVKNIDPATIVKINILKDEKATKKYKDKGLNGVVEIIVKSESAIKKTRTEVNKAEERTEVKVAERQVTRRKAEGFDHVVYPNPAEDQIFVKYNTGNLKGDVSVTIYDLKGQSVCHREGLHSGSNMISISTKDMKNGTYIYTINVGQEVVARDKVTVNR